MLTFESASTMQISHLVLEISQVVLDLLAEQINDHIFLDPIHKFLILEINHVVLDLLAEQIDDRIFLDPIHKFLIHVYSSIYLTIVLATLGLLLLVLLVPYRICIKAKVCYLRNCGINYFKACYLNHFFLIKIHIHYFTTCACASAVLTTSKYDSTGYSTTLLLWVQFKQHEEY